MSSKRGATLFKNKSEKNLKNRRKHYVVLHEWNQSKSKSRVEQDVNLVFKKLTLKLIG